MRKGGGKFSPLTLFVAMLQTVLVVLSSLANKFVSPLIMNCLQSRPKKSNGVSFNGNVPKAERVVATVLLLLDYK